MSNRWLTVKARIALGTAVAVAGLVTGLDHVLAMVAVGIWGAQLGAPAIWVLPVTFPMVMALGGMAGLLGLGLPAVEVGIGLSALLLGAMVALEQKADLRLAAVLVGFFAVFHGYAHGTELPEGQSGLLYSIGFVVSTGLLHGAGIGIGELRRLNWGRNALRAAGGAIALAGLWFTWSAVAG
jgi:urease accessory protein